MNNIQTFICGSSAAIALILSSNVLAGPACDPFEKQVSVDEGLTWHDADDRATAPTQTIGQTLQYRFTVSDCSVNAVDYEYYRFRDVKIGLADWSAWVDFGPAPIVVTSDTVAVNYRGVPVNFGVLSQTLTSCDKDGFFPNTAALTVETPGKAVIEEYSDSAYVKCEEPVIGRLGDYVWEDLNANGIQDAGEPGISGVVVDLYDAGANGVCDSTNADDSFLDTTSTDSDGYYLFDNLNAANYCVVFPEAAAALDCSSKDGNRGVAVYTSTTVGDDTAVDSNAFSNGTTAVVALAQGAEDLTIDAGLFCKDEGSCDLTLEKSCRVETPPTPPLGGKCDGKIKEFSLVWNGADGVNLSPLSPLTSSVASVDNGDTVVFSSNGSSDNDVYVALSGGATGQSVFHLSCSDESMNTPDDCDKALGDGNKNSTAYRNNWSLSGLVGADDAGFTCPSAQPTDPTDSAGFGDHCDLETRVSSCFDENGNQLHKPASITLRYLGNGVVNECLDNEASRAGVKPPVCSGDLPANAVVTAIMDRKSKDSALLESLALHQAILL